MLAFLYSTMAVYPTITHGYLTSEYCDVICSSLCLSYASLTHFYGTHIISLDPENNPTPKKYKDMPIQPLGDRTKFYQNYVNSCVKKFGTKGQRCVSNEQGRMAMSLRQPQSMTNYTDVGFKKIRAPEKFYNLIKDFWDNNKDAGALEQWGTGNTYSKLDANWGKHINNLGRSFTHYLFLSLSEQLGFSYLHGLC